LGNGYLHEGGRLMSAVDPADAIQAGLYSLLDDDATLGALISGVYDSVPGDVEPAYVVVGEMLSTPDGTHDGEGRQTAATLHTWTRAESFAPGNVIGARVVALLWHQAAALDALVDGQKVWRVEHEFAQTLIDPEPGIRHRVDRFRIWSSQEET
jgi:hypothetical protein